MLQPFSTLDLISLCSFRSEQIVSWQCIFATPPANLHSLHGFHTPQKLDLAQGFQVLDSDGSTVSPDADHLRGYGCFKGVSCLFDLRARWLFMSPVTAHSGDIEHFNAFDCSYGICDMTGMSLCSADPSICL